MTRETCNDHILLVGFMGSGKTSVSRRLSAITGLSLIDVDYRIEAIQHRKIPRIFAEEGEEGFRRIETETLARAQVRGTLDHLVWRRHRVQSRQPSHTQVPWHGHLSRRAM